MLTISTGDLICAKSITHRIVLELREAKNGRQKPITNQYSYAFQGNSFLSKVGVFLFLGVYPEQTDADKTHAFAQRQMRGLGWHDSKEIGDTFDKLADALKARGLTEAEISDLYQQAGIDKGR